MNKHTEIFAESLNIRGTGLITNEEFSQLLQVAKRESAIVHTVESYEMRQGLEIPRLDLGIYGLVETDAKLEWIELLEKTHQHAQQLLDDAKQEKNEIKFKVWLDTLT